MAPVAQRGRPQRTQSERREATREALLDSMIDCLATDGYAATTNRRVAAAAGVTPGALQHHFGSKAALVSEAIRRVMSRFSEAMLSTPVPSGTPPQQRHEVLLDRMWDLHRGPLFEALIELLVAARTDEFLRKELKQAASGRAQLIEAGAPLLYPDLAGHPGLIPLVMTGQATMRGLAMLAFAGDDNIDEHWRAARGHLLQLIAALELDRPRDA
jgi:AcrR family transcriptional regulator